ncbi:MAG: histidinol-phosphate transaminase [Chloroflexi bacterium]|nr:histidinol-phosphate transaminase [Chloroflexota bacterium]MDK1045710.1 histidinol-phosphate transaminase [Anaerolineales bacterium]MCI0772284.1 histidinol-phosphate transaminase [Chloroflexota bacterium]MCI0806716.1 histidinol-phosphate transaminase [Chloroflexota bacterium]MCI0827879.1 histidinol-phosphate transaminase [Chloroflexota bacterium]
MFDPVDGIRPHLRAMAAYEPIAPFEVVSERLGRPPEEILKLDGNENPYGPLPAVREALGNLPYLHIYPDPESTILREALAEHTGVPVENLLAGAGSDELIDLLMRLMLEPGDHILVCPPTFAMYAFDAGLNAAAVLEVPRNSDFALDLPGIERAVREHSPKLVFIASPNNPDGSLLPPETLHALLDMPVVVVLDEAYVEFAPSGTSRLSEVAGRGNLVVLRTFSKWAGLAGLRVGYGAFPTGLMTHLQKVKQPYNLSVAGTAAALVCLQNIEELETIGRKIVAERERMYTALQEISYLSPYPSQSNFILSRVVGREAKEVKAALARQGILVRYFDTPELQDHLRITVGRPDQTEILLAALSELE